MSLIPRRRLGSARAAVARAAALALTAGLAAVPATATPAHADDQGTVCMFLAPYEVFGAGHVGWAYKWANGQQWDYGATTGGAHGTFGKKSRWEEHGEWKDLVDAFKNRHQASGGYTQYRCRQTAGHNQAGAIAKVGVLAAQDYNLATNNCLTDTIQIFKTYDSSGGLNSLDAGRYTRPNEYFKKHLDGFNTAANL
ncbi:hypothetical protein ACFY2W_25975 [Streptomyces sp. NPDC001262]|uniref:hypothetical protein n=1 Tax=Streptomyces sp. NPDC001262 TaxID=3364552 RepID=UPI0036CB8ED5